MQLDLEFYLLRGLSGVDAWQEGIAVYAGLPPFLNQSEPLNCQIQVASTFSKIGKVVLNGELWQNNRKIRSLGSLQESLAFDLPVDWQLQQNLNDLPDGEYELRLNIQYGQNQEFTARKTCQLSGRVLADLLQTCQRHSTGLTKRKNLPAGTLFSLRVLLEQLRQAIAEGKVSTARQLLAEFEKNNTFALPQ